MLRKLFLAVAAMLVIAGATAAAIAATSTVTVDSSSYKVTKIAPGHFRITYVPWGGPTPNPPTAAFTSSPASPTTGSPVHVDGTASVCNAAPCTYTYIDTGNGTQLNADTSQPSFDFTFQVVGTKHVLLTVADSIGQTASVSHDVVVSTPTMQQPTNTGAPAITGIPMPAASNIPGAGTVSTTNGTWTGSPTSFTYQWQHCDATGGSCASESAASATTATYTIQPSDTNKTVQVVVTAHNAAGAGTATAITGPAPALWYAGRTLGSGAQDGNLLNMINPNPPNASYVDAVHAANPNAIVLSYVEGENTVTSQSGTNNICIDPAFDWTLAANDSAFNDPAHDYFLYNSNGWGSGNRIFDNIYGLYEMDPGNSTWVSACGNYNLSRTASWHLLPGTDGFFTDDLSMFQGQALKSATGGYANDAAYIGGLAAQMTTLGGRYHANGFINISNISGTCRSPASTYETGQQSIATAADGSMEEDFPWPNTSQNDPQWSCKVGEGIGNESHGKWFIAVGDQNTTTEAGITYSLASYLMEANGHSVFEISNFGAPATWFAALSTAMQLGPATSGEITRSIGGVTVYERDYKNGVAVVNPSSSTTAAFAPEAAGGTYSGRECNGIANSCSTLTNATAVTLAADGGAVLKTG